MERTFRRIQVAVKNTDTREHDLLDADDYFQYHGGMVATVRHLTGASPRAYVGDYAAASSAWLTAPGQRTTPGLLFLGPALKGEIHA